MLPSNAQDRAKWPALIGLVLSSVLLARSLPTSFAFDKVVHSAILTLACSGGAVLALSKRLPGDWSGSHKGQQYDSVPLGELGRPHASRDPSPVREQDGTPVSLRKLRVTFVVLVLALCGRVELLRDIIRNVQCATFTWEPLVPLAFVLLDRYDLRRRTTLASSEVVVNNHLRKWLTQTVLSTSHLIVASVTLVSFAGMLALRSTSNPHSTVVCAAVLPYRWLIPLLQRLGSALDVVILYCTSQLLAPHQSRPSHNLALRLASVGYALLFSAGMLFTIGVVYFVIQDQDRNWILTIPHLYFWSVLKLNLLIVFVLLCALISILSVGLLTTTLIATFTTIMTITTTSAWTNSHAYPFQSFNNAYLGICLFLLGFIMYVYLDASSDNFSTISTVLFRRVPALFSIGILLLFFIWTSLWSSHNGLLNYHPIDRLIFEAQEHHKTHFVDRAVTATLAEAVREYERRYSRLPPPQFDMWFEYAAGRNAAIIHPFDGIDRDLQPFFALTPEEIRRKTWELISNPWNDAAGVMIRDGKVEIAPNVMGTHKWMVDGLIEMISKFSQWLPDMDLAFNLNDEPRVAVPFEVIEPIRESARMSNIAGESIGLRKTPNMSFSSGRADQWLAIPDEQNSETPLQEISWQKTFHRYGMVGCPPDSPARTQRLWDTGTFCNSCANPQSLGAFLANWTAAADICHQPDMADLHGLYLSPAAFKGTHQLYPIFSQSKAHGFNDIIYPSAWNYLEKAKHDPTEEFPDNIFSEKEDILFWRGATSEGVSKGRGSWRSMTRQRFIHMANNVNNCVPHQSLLLPAQGRPDKLEYVTIPSSKLTELLPTDIHIVESILRCAWQDCGDQDTEFAPLVPPADFQSHWKYKYLLDMDGAGFSGRFIAFLQSNSLPFKSALFREWWDDRITPWCHFVPLDLRGQGFWATFAYFHGVNGIIKGKEVKVDAHAAEAERIARDGSEWAKRVLRKEDMEIYFFRLLLEWGRLTDDARDTLGFDV